MERVGNDVKDVFSPSSYGSTRTQNHRMKSQRGPYRSHWVSPSSVLVGKSKAQREEEAHSESQGSTLPGPAETEWSAHSLFTSYVALLPN